MPGVLDQTHPFQWSMVPASPTAQISFGALPHTERKEFAGSDGLKVEHHPPGEQVSIRASPAASASDPELSLLPSTAAAPSPSASAPEPSSFPSTDASASVGEPSFVAG